MLRWRIIFEDYGLDIEYIKGEKNKVAEILSVLPMNRNQDTTQDSTYKKKIVLEINDTK